MMKINWSTRPGWKTGPTGPSWPLLAGGLALGLFLGLSQWAIAQQAIRLFGTTSAGNPIAVKVDTSGNMLVTATGSSSGQFPTLLTSSTTQAATGANTTETDLWTYSMPAGKLGTDGWGVRIVAFGTTAANANNKTVKCYFGATAVSALSFTTSGAHWRCDAIVLRSGAATQVASGDVEVALGNQQNAVTTPAETLSGAVTIKMTGQNGVAAANDIVFRGATVQLLR